LKLPVFENIGQIEIKRQEVGAELNHQEIFLTNATAWSFNRGRPCKRLCLPKSRWWLSDSELLRRADTQDRYVVTYDGYHAALGRATEAEFASEIAPL
jgi:hypothetical protein